MKKIVLTVIMVGMTAFAAQAEVKITWFATSATNLTTGPDNTTPAPIGWLTQFIWVSNGGMLSTPTTSNPFGVSADEILLSEQTLNGTGSPAFAGRIASHLPGFTETYDGDDSPGNPGDGLAGGMVYARVFNIEASISAGAPTPTFYGVSALAGNSVDAGGPGLNPSLGITVTTGDPTTANSIDPVAAVNMAIVPEPSTYALLAFGGVIAFWRSRKNS